MEKLQTRELISALADGQLRGEALVRGVDVAASDPVAREAWHTYHLIGDVLRSGELPAGTAPTEFLSRLQLRLQQEQRGWEPAPAGAAAHDSAVAPVREAANDASFRWKLVAGLASVAAVMAIAWTAVGGLGGPAEQGQLAAARGGALLVGNERGVMIRDPQLDEFLAAHRQLGGASALQMPAGFLRSATFEGSHR